MEYNVGVRGSGRWGFRDFGVVRVFREFRGLGFRGAESLKRPGLGSNTSKPQSLLKTHPDISYTALATLNKLKKKLMESKIIEKRWSYALTPSLNQTDRERKREINPTPKSPNEELNMMKNQKIRKVRKYEQICTHTHTCIYIYICSPPPPPHDRPMWGRGRVMSVSA